MSDELRAARERLRAGDYPDAEDTPMGFYVSPTQQNDMHVVIENDLASHLPDDGEPITEAMLPGLGFNLATTKRRSYRNGPVLVSPPCGGLDWWVGVGVGDSEPATCVLFDDVPTLGDMRALLAALKVGNG